MMMMAMYSMMMNINVDDDSLWGCCDYHDNDDDGL